VFDIVLLESKSESESGSGGRSVFGAVNNRAGCSVVDGVGCTSKSVVDSVDDSSGRRRYGMSREEVRSSDIEAISVLFF
jgi:hypothetical protein